MAVKSVIDIDVNDEAFQKFSEKFESYRNALKKLPGQWAAVTSAGEAAQETFASMAAAMMAQNAIASTTVRQTNQVNTASRSAANAWKDIARATRSTAGDLLRITGTLLKWTGLAGIFGGLLGVGSIFGLDRLAGSVAQGRRSSQGLGTTYGEQKAFGINYGTLVEPNSYLGAVNQALHSWTERGAFYAAGMNPNDLKGTTGDVGVALLGRLKHIADTTNPAGLADVMRARGLDQFVTIQDMMRLRAMKPEEFRQYSENYARDAKSLNLPAETQSAWQRFMQQMDRAGEKIGNILGEKLVKLEPSLEKLSGSFVHLIESLSDSDTVKRWIDRAAQGLEKFAGVVAKPEFEQNVLKIVRSLGEVAEGLVAFARGMRWLMEKLHLVDKGDDTKDTPPGWRAPMALMAPGTPEWEAEGRRLEGKGIPGAVIPSDPGTGKEGPWTFAEKERAHGLPRGLLWSVYGAESSFGANRSDSKAGARGPFQLMPGTASDLGVVNPYDLGEASEGAGKYLEQLTKRFRGNIPQAIAAYNWGPANMEAFIKTGKGAKGQPMPDETKDYVIKVMAGLPKDQREAAYESAGRDKSGLDRGELQSVVRAIGEMTRQMSSTRVDIYNHAGANVIAQSSQIAR